MNEAGERWLAFAREDLRVAEIVLKEEIYNQACFHAQQSVEKSLKASLAHHGRVPPRTHAIADLLGFLALEEWADLWVDLLKMDNYYIPTRYPGALTNKRTLGGMQCNLGVSSAMTRTGS